MNKIQETPPVTENNLIDVRCPFKFKSKSNNELYPCNRICVRVEPGSKGEILCPSCKLKFDFEVSAQSQSRIFVKMQPIVQ